MFFNTTDDAAPAAADAAADAIAADDAPQSSVEFQVFTSCKIKNRRSD